MPWPSDSPGHAAAAWQRGVGWRAGTVEGRESSVTRPASTLEAAITAANIVALSWRAGRHLRTKVEEPLWLKNINI